MKAVAYQQAGSIAHAQALQDVELPRPAPGPHDLLVEIAAVSVNPVDTKIRNAVSPAAGDWKILGWDGVGRVVEAGADVRGFSPGDTVFYAGDLSRPGTNAQFHLVDARIAALAPRTLSAPQAAALPLTAITAWEMLFDRLDVTRLVPGAAPAILIIGGAGGVGSIAIQLAKALTGLTVIATASRPETRDWVMALGADHVIDHRQPLAPQIAALGLGAPAFVFSTTGTGGHLEDIAALIAPQGRFGLIDDPETLNIVAFKRKSVSVHWELMFTRSLYQTQDMDNQGELLAQVARLVDAGKLRTTLTQTLSPINAETLMQAHHIIESGTARGKIVLHGF